MSEKTRKPPKRLPTRQPPRYTLDQQARLDRIQDRLLAAEPYRTLRDLATEPVLPKLVDKAVVELGVAAAEKAAGASLDMPRDGSTPGEPKAL